MKQMRIQWSAIAVTVLAVLCIIALYISYNIARIDYQRKNQIISQKPGVNKGEVQVAGKFIQAGKISEQALYYNGQRIEGISCYKWTSRDS